MAPRSILKARACALTLQNLTSAATALPFADSQPLLTPHVHFPPTPRMSSFTHTHSPSAYDRAPIDVSPNLCALPDRDCRVYSLSEEARRSRRTARTGSPVSWSYSGLQSPVSLPIRGYFDPMSYQASEGIQVDEPPPSYHDMPSLMPDLSSESEESDSQIPSPLPPSIPPNPAMRQPIHGKLNHDLSYAVSFLPHSGTARHSASKRRRYVGTPGGCFAPAVQDDGGCLGGF